MGVLSALDSPGLVGYPPTMQTDACLRFSVMGHQSAFVAFNHCEAAKSLLARLTGRATKGRVARKTWLNGPMRDIVLLAALPLMSRRLPLTSLGIAMTSRCAEPRFGRNLGRSLDVVLLWPFAFGNLVRVGTFAGLQVRGTTRCDELKGLQVGTLAVRVAMTSRCAEPRFGRNLGR